MLFVAVSEVFEGQAGNINSPASFIVKLPQDGFEYQPCLGPILRQPDYIPPFAVLVCNGRAGEISPFFILPDVAFSVV